LQKSDIILQIFICSGHQDKQPDHLIYYTTDIYLFWSSG